MVSVHAATAAEIDTVVALRLALVREANDHPLYRRLRPDAAHLARRAFRQQLESAAEATFLATSDTGPLGILRCVESQGSPLLDPARYAYISSVYVLPSARRSGILRALLAAAMDWCRARRLEEVRLHSVAGDAVANAVWERMGFAVVEHLRSRPVTASTRVNSRSPIHSAVTR